MRLTNILCTIGPKTANKDAIAALSENGMDIARINCAHGTLEEYKDIIANVRRADEASGRTTGILIDVKGPEIRTGDVREPLAITRDELVVFSPRDLPQEKRSVIRVNYDAFSSDVRETTVILLDNGEMSFDIVSIEEDGTVIAKAKDDGSIGSRRHVNLPGANIDLPSLTEKDWKHIAFAIEQDLDFVAVSFVRSDEEMLQVRTFLDENGSSMRAIAKIETQQALNRIDAIIAASDGIMVARGDLGAEIPFERIPAVQDDLVEKCRAAGKPVIIATHMLESMIEHPMPTRAEVTDIAHAAMTRADATMLSGETATGKHPLAALKAMDRILRETEKHVASIPPPRISRALDERQARAEAAVTMATSLHVPAILVLTKTGRTAERISQLRPPVPVFALTDSQATRRRLKLHFAVQPLTMNFQEDPEDNVQQALMLAKATGALKSGEQVVVVSDAKVHSGSISTVQVRTIS